VNNGYEPPRTLEEKIATSREVVGEALERYAVDRLRIAWTGGKDSTLLLWLIRAVCLDRGAAVPTCFCIDEGDMFDEARAFI